MAYFNGDSISTTMLRIRGEPGMARYDLLIDEQEVVIGWDNLIWGKFSKQWKIQQKAYVNRRKLLDPRTYARVKRNKKRKAATDKKQIKEEN